MKRSTPDQKRLAHLKKAVGSFQGNIMRTYDFSVALSAEEVHSIYAGRTRYILVKSDTGVKLRLPAVNFRQFVTTDGIYGRFSVTVDAQNKLKALRKL